VQEIVVAIWENSDIFIQPCYQNVLTF